LLKRFVVVVVVVICLQTNEPGKQGHERIAAVPCTKYGTSAESVIRRKPSGLMTIREEWYYFFGIFEEGQARVD
jgi:hypothetical protein